MNCNFISVFTCQIQEDGSILHYIKLKKLTSVIFTIYLITLLGRENVVCIATRYGLNGLGNETRLGEIFPQNSRRTLGLTQPPIQWVPVYSGVKAAGAWCWSPASSSADVKENVELYLCPPFGPPSWSVVGRYLPLSLFPSNLWSTVKTQFTKTRFLSPFFLSDFGVKIFLYVDFLTFLSSVR